MGLRDASASKNIENFSSLPSGRATTGRITQEGKATSGEEFLPIQVFISLKKFHKCKENQAWLPGRYWKNVKVQQAKNFETHAGFLKCSKCHIGGGEEGRGKKENYKLQNKQ